jgi:hypothetical protein
MYFRQLMYSANQHVSALVRVARDDVASNLFAFFELAANDQVGGRGAGVIALLKFGASALFLGEEETSDVSLSTF